MAEFSAITQLENNQIGATTGLLGCCESLTLDGQVTGEGLGGKITTRI
jgi:hypothetical protein